MSQWSNAAASSSSWAAPASSQVADARQAGRAACQVAGAGQAGRAGSPMHPGAAILRTVISLTEDIMGAIAHGQNSGANTKAARPLVSGEAAREAHAALQQPSLLHPLTAVTPLAGAGPLQPLAGQAPAHSADFADVAGTPHDEVQPVSWKPTAPSMAHAAPVGPSAVPGWSGKGTDCGQDLPRAMQHPLEAEGCPTLLKRARFRCPPAQGSQECNPLGSVAPRAHWQQGDCKAAAHQTMPAQGPPGPNQGSMHPTTVSSQAQPGHLSQPTPSTSGNIPWGAHHAAQNSRAPQGFGGAHSDGTPAASSYLHGAELHPEVASSFAGCCDTPVFNVQNPGERTSFRGVPINGPAEKCFEPQTLCRRPPTPQGQASHHDVVQQTERQQPGATHHDTQHHGPSMGGPYSGTSFPGTPYSGRPSSGTDYSGNPFTDTPSPSNPYPGATYLGSQSVSDSNLKHLLSLLQLPAEQASSFVRDIPPESLERMHIGLWDIVGDPSRKEDYGAMSRILEARKDLDSVEVLVAMPRKLLRMLLAARTGVQVFLHHGFKMSKRHMAEVFLRRRCKNVTCQRALPASGCPCATCRQPLGFCGECMCLVCMKFDFHPEVRPRVHCPRCRHWCHLDCAQGRGIVQMGKGIEQASHEATGDGPAFRCPSCFDMVSLLEVAGQCTKTQNWSSGNPRTEDCVQDTVTGMSDASALEQGAHSQVRVSRPCGSLEGQSTPKRPKAQGPYAQQLPSPLTNITSGQNTQGCITAAASEPMQPPLSRNDPVLQLAPVPCHPSPASVGRPEPPSTPVPWHRMSEADQTPREHVSPMALCQTQGNVDGFNLQGTRTLDLLSGLRSDSKEDSCAPAGDPELPVVKSHLQGTPISSSFAAGMETAVGSFPGSTGEALPGQSGTPVRTSALPGTAPKELLTLGGSAAAEPAQLSLSGTLRGSRMGEQAKGPALTLALGIRCNEAASTAHSLSRPRQYAAGEHRPQGSLSMSSAGNGGSVSGACEKVAEQWDSGGEEMGAQLRGKESRVVRSMVDIQRRALELQRDAQRLVAVLQGSEV